MSDDTLVARAKAGDPSAWHLLFEAHAGRLLLWLRARATYDPASADDIAAEAWMIASRRIAEFAGSSDELAGWLFGIARNVARNERRKSARRGVVDARQRDGGHRVLPSPEDHIEGLEQVKAILSPLPQREREVVVCIDVVGLDVAGTAQALGMRAGAVRVAHHRALQRLRLAGAEVAS